MSTISDALKKAQKQRLADPAGVKPPPVNKLVKASLPPGEASSGRPYPVVWILAVVVGLLLAVSIWVTREGSLQFARLPASVLPPAQPGVVTPRVEPAGTEIRTAVVKEAVAAVVPVQAPPAATPAPVAAREPLVVPVLSAIFFSPRNPLAIINGESVKMGESVGGWKVVEIQAESVRLEGEGGERVVKLK
jgi:hypothetical protein